MHRAHLVPVALAFLAGIASDTFGVAWLVLAASVALLALAYAVHTARTGYDATPLAVMLAALALGALDGEIFGHAGDVAADRHVSTLEATVVDVPPATDAGSGFRELVVRLADGSGARVALPRAEPIGERLRLRAERETFDGARNPGEPSQRELERARGIAWRLVHARILARAPPEPGDASLWLARARAAASERLHTILAEPDATILAGALWGERGALPGDLRDEFQDTGTVHVLVTAGLHLGVVAAVSIALLHYLRFGRIGASLAAIAIVWLYAAFSGDHLPSVRAATMLTVALVARAIGRESLSWNALAVAAIVVAAISPAAVTSVSFGLSFSCVAAIFAFAKPIAAILERWDVPHGVAALASVSVATQIGTWPLTAAAFLVIAPYAPLANACVVPLVGVAMLAGAAALATAPVPLLSVAVQNVTVSLVDWIVAAVRFVATLPGAHVVATPPPVWTIAAYDAALVVAARCFARERTLLACGIIGAATALCLWPPRATYTGLTVTAIDVGQADALLVQTPAGHAYLVDAGGKLERGALGGASSAEDVGTRTVVPFLVRSGIQPLDAILLSHPHGDHAGGVAPVLRALGANAFADSGQTYDGHAYRDALATAATRGVPMLEPRGGDVWRTNDGVTFRFYGPTLPYITGSRSDINSNSLVFRLEFGRTRMLFTGDAGADTEQRLLASRADIRAEVLKVGHHGSAYGTTSEFVRAVAPSVAIVSVGRHNLFGHPAAATLDTLSAYGARIYRTDTMGAISLRSDGATIAVEPFLTSTFDDRRGGLQR